MDTKKNYFIAGVFTLVLSLGIVIFLAWMMGATQVSSSTKKLVISFKDLNGLSEGSQVEYRGVQVGHVTKIEFDPKQPEHVLVETQIASTTPLQIDSKATVGTLGITGLAYVQLETENSGQPKLTLWPGQDYYFLRGGQSRFDQLIEKAPELLDKYTEVAQQLLQLFTTKNIQTTSDALAHIEKITRNLAKQEKNFNRLLSQTNETVESFRVNTEKSFVDLNGLLVDSQEAANEIKELARDVKNNPSSILYQPSYNGYQVKK